MNGSASGVCFCWRRIAVLLCLAGVFAELVSGCRLPPVIPGGKSVQPLSAVELEEQLMRFTDDFTARMVNAIDKLHVGTNALDRLENYKLKLVYVNDTLAVATGPNAVANLLDMVALVSLSRMAVEEHWLPNVYGESARPMLEACQRSESNIWQIAGQVLKPEQIRELRAALDRWRKEHADITATLYTRALGLAAQIAKETQKEERSQPGSVFGLLMIDPFAGLDPAARELAQTRLFAERALFLGQRLPQVIRWQTELLALNALRLPEVEQALTNTSSVSASLERLSRLADELPDKLSAERQQITTALESQAKGLTQLASETRQALTAGTQMASNVDATLKTFDGLVQRLNSGPPSTNAEPFRIQDYTQAAAQIDAASQRLTELLRTADQTLGSTNLSRLAAQVAPAVDHATERGKDTVNFLFLRAVLFVAIACALVLITAQANRMLSSRSGAHQAATPPEPRKTQQTSS